eukprot:2055709-Alexandrium_andersonii.AAC.1
MHLTWELATVFKVLRVLKALANFLMLFCQFHGIPARNTAMESAGQQLVPIPLDRRWADYFNRCDEFVVDKQHFAFKMKQIAFRDDFGGRGNIPIPDGRYCPVMVPYSKADTEDGLTVLIQQR